MSDLRNSNDNFEKIDVVVEAVKARIFAVLNAMSPAEVRQLVAEIEDELGSSPK